MTRQTKTPKQRAEEDLATANRKVVRLERDCDQLKIQLVTKQRHFNEALTYRDFLKQHPALQPTPTQSTTPTTTEEGNNA